MLKIDSGCVSVFLNRDCPRRCPYCNVANIRTRQRLSVEEWKRAFTVLEKRGVKFFLVLGTEPLVLAQDLVELVRFWRKKDYEYGLYTTSPRFWFDRFKDKLLESGIRNWSSGIDFVPEVYTKVKSDLSVKCRELVDREGDGLVRKAEDGLYGMDYMFSRGIEEQHVLITISRMNIEFVPDMVRYLVDRFDNPRVRVAMNFVEWSEDDDFDFATPKKDCMDFIFTEKDKWVWESFVERMISLPDRYKLRMQVPVDYLMNWGYVLNLNRPGDYHFCAMGIECDGSLRRCGYRKGSLSEFSVFDLIDDRKFKEIYDRWVEEVSTCPGCYWVFPWLLEKFGIGIVDYRSELWERRKRRYNETSSS